MTENEWRASPRSRDGPSAGKTPLRWYEAAVLIPLAAVALLWPAILNKGPFWSPDTSHYVRAADAAFVSVTGTTSEWSNRLIVANSEPAIAQDSGHSSKKIAQDDKREITSVRPIITGRSIYYGLLIYTPLRSFGQWGAIFVQALFVAMILLYTLAIIARVSELDPRILIVASVACCALLTPLPYFTSMLMPDVYSGLIILVMATAICFWTELTANNRVALLSASAIMATFHTTHILIAAAIAATAALIFFRGRNRLLPVLVTMPVVASALVAGGLFSYAVKSQLGHGPISPPFLSARMIASGLGTEYLKRHCRNVEIDFTLCRYRDRFPLQSDGFLWSSKQDDGLFQIVSPEEQRKIASEDKDFFLAVLKEDPVKIIELTIYSTVKTMSSFGLSGFNYPQERTKGFLSALPKSISDGIARSGAARQEIPTTVAVDASVLLTIVSSLAVLALALFSLAGTPSIRDVPFPSRLRQHIFLCALAVLANAAICGVLSKPTARYQMRIIWVLPVVALVIPGSLWLGLGRRRSLVHE